MAATVSSPWSKPGAWALDAEEHEAELQQEHENSQQASTFAAQPLGGVAEFPSLAAAAATKQPKKKKNQTLSLAEFSNYSPAKSSHEPDLFNLPTRPRERSAEELDRARLGGGFKSYGLSYRNGGEESNSRWGGGGGGGNGNTRVSNRESSKEFAPSRADEIDDWSKTKKSPAGNVYERRERERGSSFFDSQSKADESASWVSNKTTNDGPRRFGGANNGGFERRGSYDSLSRERHGFSGGAADSDNWGRKKDESFNSGSVGERPKLKLQPRTLPVTVSDGNGAVEKPKGSNPFGDARPREEVLKEKGMDYKEIDEKLDSVKISSERSKDVERSDSFGKRGFGIGRGGSGNERSWRKPDVADSGSRPQSAETTENGNNAEDGLATEDEVVEGN